MKIRNDLVSIKIGKKKYDFKNLILDEYLKRFVIRQLGKSGAYSTNLSYCLLKFDTPFVDLKNNSELCTNDFDVCLLEKASNVLQEVSKQGVTIQYTYNGNGVVWDYKRQTAENNYIRQYYGRKITAIGFSNTWIFTTEVRKYNICAILDTSNYNIYLQKNQELTITRKDTISSDALFYCDNSRIKGPIHLCPAGGESILRQDKIIDENGTINNIGAQPTDGILYSIGLSPSSTRIEKEFIIGKDIQIEQIDNKLIIKDVNNCFCRESEYVLHPSNYLYPNENIFPLQSKYRYVIFKYKIWQDIISYKFNSEENCYENVYTSTDTGVCYYQAIEISKNGLLNLEIKYERSLNNEQN